MVLLIGGGEASVVIGRGEVSSCYLVYSFFIAFLLLKYTVFKYPFAFLLFKSRVCFRGFVTE